VVDATSTTGYRAANATSGTRLAMDILDLPMALDVVTNEFITDTGATDFKEALAYTSGAVIDIFEAGSGNNRAANEAYSGERSPSASAAGTNTEFTNSISIRTFRTDTQQRSGFRIGGSVPSYGLVLGGLTDSINTERLEVVKGPAALLYGVNVLGGVVNIIPKRPLSEPRSSLTFTAGSEDFLRTAGEHTGPLLKEVPGLGGQINYRIAGAWDERGDWTDHKARESSFGTAQFEYLHRRFRLFTEFQIGSLRLNGIGEQFIYDKLTGGGTNANTDSVWVLEEERFRNAFNEQYTWQRDGEELADRGYPGFADFGPEFRITGPDPAFERDEWTALVDLEIYPVEKLVFKFAGLLTDLDVDELAVNVTSPNNQNYDVSFTQSLTNPIRIDEDLVTIFDNVPSDPENPLSPSDLRDRKMVRYWWARYPVDSRSEQARVEATYEFNTSLFGSEAKHVFLAGGNYIRDNVHHITRRADAREVTKMPNRQEVYQMRSIYDQSLIRYTGEPLAYPAKIDDLVVNGIGAEELIPSLSGQQETTIWQKGLYGVYQGFFFDEKLYAMFGVRRDSLQVFEQEYGVIVQNVEEIPNPDLPFLTINYQTLRGLTDNYVREEYNFDESLAHTSYSWALRYSLTDQWSAYFLSSEGVFPNTGLRDGNDNPIEPETTQNHELGLKFELYEGKLSGSIAVFRVERENAVWFWSEAPNPRSFATNKEEVLIRGNEFDPAAVEDGSFPITYAVNSEYFNTDWFPKKADGTPLFVDENGKNFPGIALIDLGGDPKIYLEYDKLDTAGYPLNPDVTWRQVLEEAFADRRAGRDDIVPIFYGRIEQGNNPSNGRGANVTFTDKATGGEFNLTYAPMENWQFIFNFTHIEREVEDTFNLALPVDFNTGELYATEYDAWVASLGRDAFEDPKNPGTLTGGGIAGTSLYFGPKVTGSFWQKYTFDDGLLADLGFGLGVIYTGPAQTSVEVGGASMAENRFRTPDTKERYRFDAAIYYHWTLWDIDFRASFNVYNVFDDTYGLSTVAYFDEVNNREERRRSERFYAPRSFRFALSMAF
jgi:outer membrane receptor protein involved in Fe transport